jgi:hypothetical protein
MAVPQTEAVAAAQHVDKNQQNNKIYTKPHECISHIYFF